MIIFSDLHLREESADVVFNEVLPGVLDACLKNRDTRLACLGDFYHFRYRIDVRLQNRVRAWLQEVAGHGIRIYLLPGNHDQVDFAGRNALEVFEDIGPVKVLTEPQWNEHGLWIPYRKRTEDIEKALALPRPQNSGNVLFMHHGIRGAMMNNHHQDTEGLPQDMFKGWDRILCGHYHKRQTLGSVTYIGSPYQTKADEADQEKGYAIWDVSGLCEVPMDWGPRYFNVHLTEGHQFDLSQVRPQDIVRVRTAPGIDPKKVGSFLKGKGVNGVVTPEVQVSEARMNLPEGSSLDSYAMEYVKLSNTKLDKNKLNETFKGIVR